MKHLRHITEKKPKGAPDWHDSDAPDANGRFKDLSIKDLAAWLIKTRKKDVKRISGSLTQQIVFNRNDDPKYAEKMEKTRKEVYKQLGREDLLESTLNEGYQYFDGEMARDLKGDSGVKFKKGDKVTLEIQPNNYVIYGPNKTKIIVNKRDFRGAIDQYVIYESITEGMSKSAIKKAIKVIDKQIDTETGGDGEALDNETLQALEQERERLLAMNEKREDVGKYNTVKKVIKELGRRPSEQELATFINNNYYDVTEVERGEDDPAANDKIADLVGFYKFDIDDWEIAWADAQNESVVNEASKDKMIRQIERALKDGLSIFKLPMATQKYYNKNKGDFEVVAEKGYNMEDIYDLIAFHRFNTDFRKLSSKNKEWVENDAKERGFNESLLESDITDKYYSLIDELYEAKPGPDAYMTGLSDKEKEEKEAKMKKQAEMDDDDPDSYEELPGDEEARESGKVKKSKHTTAYDKKFKKESMHNLKSFDNFISEEKVTEAKAYKLKASEFGGDTHSAAYNVKGETTWRVHSTYAIDQVSGENNPEERDVVFFEAMPINNDIYIKIGGINNLKRSNGATVGNNFSTTIDEWKIDSNGIAKEASDFLTDATHLKWINKKARSEGQAIKWALKDDYSSVIEDLVNKSLGLTEEVVYNSSNTKPEAAKQATKEFGKLLPKPNKGVEPYEFAVIKTKKRNYRLAIKSGSYVAHEFMTNLRDDGVLTADIVKNAVSNIIKMNPEEFNESMVNNQSIFSGIVQDFEDFVKEKKSLNEANKGKVHRAAKKGSYPAVIVVIQDGKVIHQEPVSTPDVAPATFNVMQEKYPKALLHLEDNTGKRLFSESIVNEASDASLIKKLTDTFDKFKLPRKYEIMMASIYGGGSKWAVLRKKKEYREGCVIDTLYIDGGSNYEGYIELKDARSGRPISGKNRFAADEIDDAMEAAVKHVDGIKESNNVDRLLSNIDESKQSDELAIAINSAIVDIDDSMSYVDFAQAVGKVIRDEYGTHLYKEFKKEINKSLKESFNELRSTPLSGTMAGSTQSLEDRKYKLKKDVKGARIGDFVNVTLPKGTIIYNLPGGLFADHFSLKSKYTTSYGNGPKWLSQSWGQGVSIRQMPDILDAIEKNSKVLESAITEAKLTRGLKPLLTIGSTITKNAGEDALLDLSDKFDRIDDEYAGTIASWLDMAIELMQDRYAGAATKKLKQFNKACKDVLNGKEVGSAFESVTENRMLRKGQFKFGAKLQYGIEDVNESYGFYGTLTNQFGLDEVNELFLDGFAVLDTNYDFTDQAALYYLNSKAGRWVADQVIEKLIGAKNMSPYYGHLEEIFAEYAKKGQWKKWAKEYDQFAEEDNMEEGLMVRESRSSKDEYYRELLEAEQTTNDQSPLGDGGMETGIENKAKESGVPVGLLRIIMRRGLAAWKTGHRPGATQAQWGYARVNSFLTKQPGTWGKADSDIAKKVRDGGHDKDL